MEAFSDVTMDAMNIVTYTMIHTTKRDIFGSNILMNGLNAMNVTYFKHRNRVTTEPWESKHAKNREDFIREPKIFFTIKVENHLMCTSEQR